MIINAVGETQQRRFNVIGKGMKVESGIVGQVMKEQLRYWPSAQCIP